MVPRGDGARFGVLGLKQLVNVGEARSFGLNFDDSTYCRVRLKLLKRDRSLGPCPNKEKNGEQLGATQWWRL